MKDTPYTNSLSEDIAQTVRGIPCEEFDSFRCHATSFDEGDNEWTSWKEAKRNPNTNLWNVRLITKHEAENENDSVIQRETTLKSVCYFDALHACALYQMQQAAQGAAVIEEESDISHYGTVAMQTKQPLDLNGLPHPAAFGDILTDGLFNGKAHKLAAETKNVKIVPVTREDVAKQSLQDILGDYQSSLPAVQQGNAMAEVMQSANVKQDIERALRYAWTLTEKFELATHETPKERLADYLFLFTIVGAMIVPQLRSMWAVDKFLIVKKKLDKEINKIPDGVGAKSLLQEFSRASDLNMTLGRAAYVSEVCEEQNKPASYLKDGIKLIEKAGKKHGLADNEIVNLKAAFLHDKFPSREKFNIQNEKRYEELETRIHELTVNM